jgi:predicted ATPase
MLIRHRITAGLSQRELAERSGLSERALRDLERGTTVNPRRSSVRAVASALGLHGDDLTRFFAAALASNEEGRATIPPAPIDDLVGRGQELRRLADLVTGDKHRLVSVTGAGGVGKSRLVAELVTVLRRQTNLDIRTLDLAGLSDPELVAEAIAETLDIGGGSRLAPVERVASAVRKNRLLLVLDRFEHLLPAAGMLAELVRRCPRLSVLLTSQRRLRINGERQFPLEPLPLAASVELFTRRATAVSPRFTLTEENAEAVAAICRAVEGLPLAVELAAARTRMMTPVELAERFDRQLRLLTDGAADLPARHRSLRATIESSLEVVTEEGRTLFAWLGAFAGGGLLPDLEAVAAMLGSNEDWLLAALSELVDTSLVRVQTTNGASRYLMPDAMTELAREQLAARADRDRVQRAVAVRFLYWVRQFEREPTRDGRRDADNVHTAARFAIASDIALLDPNTIRALYTYYEFTGRLDEGKRLLIAAGTAGVPIAYLYAGRLTRFLGDLTEAARLGHLAMATMHETAETHMHLGAVATEAGESVQARKHFRAALVASRRAKDIGLCARALNGLGALSAETGRLEHAERLFTAALEAKRRSGANDLELRAPLHNLAEIALELGLYERAIARVDQVPLPLPSHLIAQTATVRALALLGLGRPEAARQAARQVEQWLAQCTTEHRYAALIHLRYSVVLAATGEPAAAARHLSIGLPEVLDSTQRYHVEAATALEAHAHLMAGRDAATAAQLLGAAGRLRRSQGRPASQATMATLDAAVRECRKALGDSRFEREHRAGSLLGVAALTELCELRVGRAASKTRLPSSIVE